VTSPRIFIIVGAKGGVGATTIAIKLTQQLPSFAERLIVDADLSGRRSLAAWYGIHDDFDNSRFIGTAPVLKLEAGLLAMELARTYEDGLVLRSEAILRSIAPLSQHALIVVDAPHPFAAIIRPFIARATRIIVITEPSLLGVAAAGAMLAAMGRAGIPVSSIAFVLSNVLGGDALSRAEIERTLRVPVCAELPHERDRRFDDSFTEFLNLLAASPPSNGSLDQPASRPVGNRRLRSNAETR
jgi:MinD-like ATPase involved in chromosome partitioning or flagellar assembly